VAQETTFNSPNIRQAYGGDPRDLPLYSLGDAGRYLKVNPMTLRSWVFGRNYLLKDGTSKRWDAVIQLPDLENPQLSFLNLVELHVLSGIRRIHNVRFQKVRSALAWVETFYPNEKNLLARVEFWTDKFDLFIKTSGDLICASQHGQQVIQEVVEQYLYRIERDFDKSPLRLFPFSKEIVLGFGNEEVKMRDLENTPKSIVIDPLVAFGRPSISGTGIPTNVIAGRFRAGEKIGDLSKDYEIEEKKIKQALDYEGILRRAA
jgi:uncharacterized protein (DUF433 family)